MQESSASLLRKKQHLQSMPVSLIVSIYVSVLRTALTWSSLSLFCYNKTQYRIISQTPSSLDTCTHALVSRSIYLVGAKQRRSHATRHISLPVSTSADPRRKNERETKWPINNGALYLAVELIYPSALCLLAGFFSPRVCKYLQSNCNVEVKVQSYRGWFFLDCFASWTRVQRGEVKERKWVSKHNVFSILNDLLWSSPDEFSRFALDMRTLNVILRLNNARLPLRSRSKLMLLAHGVCKGFFSLRIRHSAEFSLLKFFALFAHLLHFHATSFATECIASPA